MFKLTKEQDKGLEKLKKFVEGDRKKFLLKGYAGTGKTTLIKFLLDYASNVLCKDIICTAPTNEAVGVISRDTMRPYSKTIYALLGLRMVRTSEKETTFIQNKRFSTVGRYDVVIIDESSMLKDDLLKIIEDNIKDGSIKKVIFIGDDAQLPPVNSLTGESSVFKLKYGATLTEVKRITDGNSILELVTSIRNKVFHKYARNTSVNPNKDGVYFHTNRRGFVEGMFDDFITEEYENDPNHVRVLAYTNDVVDTYNQLIREWIFDSDSVDDYMVGENIVVDNMITKSDEVIYTTGTKLKVKSASVIKDQNGINCWSLKVSDLNGSDDEHIRVVATSGEAKYKSFLNRHAQHAKDQIKLKVPAGEAWEKYHKFVGRYAKVKYSYATTVHKSQGSTFKNVYIIESDFKKCLDKKEKNKLSYVAFSRASNQVHTMKEI